MYKVRCDYCHDKFNRLELNNDDNGSEFEYCEDCRAYV